MQNINSESDLRNAILELETRQAREGKILKEQFNLTYNSIKPINFLKNTLKEVGESQELKENILTTSVGLATGYLSKVLYEKISHSPVKKFFGSILMYGITNLVTKNPETIKTFANKLFSKINNRPGTTSGGSDKSEVRKITNPIF
jgi:hypothetical protein